MEQSFWRQHRRLPARSLRCRRNHRRRLDGYRACQPLPKPPLYFPAYAYQRRRSAIVAGKTTPRRFHIDRGSSGRYRLFPAWLGARPVCEQVVLVRTAADIVSTGQAPEPLTNARLYPNPADGRLSVQFRSKIAGTLLLQFYDGQGKICHQSQAQVAEGENQLELNLGNWPVGIYSVIGRVDGSQAGGTVVFPRLVVQRNP